MLKIASLILSSSSVLFLLSTLLCGLWLKAKGATPEGVVFHANLAVLTVILALVTVGTLAVAVVRR